MITQERADFINEQEIEGMLCARPRPEPSRVRELLAKAREMHGLSMDEVACLSFVETPELLAEIFSTAKQIKEEIYGYAAGAFCAALHLQPLLERVHVLRVSRDERCTQASHAHAGRDCGGDAHPDSPGSQAGSGCRRGSVAAAGLSIHSRLHRNHLRHARSAPARSGASM